MRLEAVIAAGTMPARRHCRTRRLPDGRPDRLEVLPRIVTPFGAWEVPRVPTRPPARDDTAAKLLNPQDKPARPTTVISTSAWPRRSLPTKFAREEKSHTATRSRLSAPQPPTPFGPGDPASPRNHVALGDLSSRDHRPGPSPRSRARRDDAQAGVVSTPAAPRAVPSLGTTGSYGFRSKRERIRTRYVNGF
jgi:hypothetical protein